jgi:hypothetical protein
MCHAPLLGALPDEVFSQDFVRSSIVQRRFTRNVVLKLGGWVGEGTTLFHGRSLKRAEGTRRLFSLLRCTRPVSRTRKNLRISCFTRDAAHFSGGSLRGGPTEDDCKEARGKSEDERLLALRIALLALLHSLREEA